MTVSSETHSRRLLERAVEARQDALRQLRQEDCSADERETLAGILFRDYSRELLNALLSIADSGDISEGPLWIRRCHDDQLLEFGRQLRDAFPDGEARHAVAQVIQRELLEAETRLKLALRLRACVPGTQP